MSSFRHLPHASRKLSEPQGWIAVRVWQRDLFGVRFPPKHCRRVRVFCRFSRGLQDAFLVLAFPKIRHRPRLGLVAFIQRGSPQPIFSQQVLRCRLSLKLVLVAAALFQLSVLCGFQCREARQVGEADASKMTSPCEREVVDGYANGSTENFLAPAVTATDAERIRDRNL